jgi:hypothetical protein
MKIHILPILLSCMWFTSCSFLKTDVVDLPGEIIWQDEDKLIKNIMDEQVAKVVILGFDKNKIEIQGASYDVHEKGIVAKGKIRSFGNITNDQVPEFLFEDITIKGPNTSGVRNILTIYNNTRISTLFTTKVATSTTNCNNSIIGTNEQFEIDSLTQGGPFLVIKGNYGFKSNAKYACPLPASGVFYFKNTKRVYTCPISNGKLNLAKLYELKRQELTRKKISPINKYEQYTLTNKLAVCRGNNDFSELETLAGTKLIGKNNPKRSDLMPYIEDEFTNINPTFIKWVSNNMIPQPQEEQANGLPYQLIYNIAYKDVFRKFALIRALIAQENQEGLLREYANATYTFAFDTEMNQKVKRKTTQY